MKIQSVSQQLFYPTNFKTTNNKNLQTKNKNVISCNKALKFVHNNNLTITKKPYTINFNGKRLHILDGGVHAKNMKFFAKSLNSNASIHMHNVELNSLDKYKYTKQLKSLLEQLQSLNKDSNIGRDDYIAIPCLASVPLLNIQDQYNKIMDEDKKFTPENVKANKKNLLTFLEKIYNNPEKYKKYIEYMDPIKCGIEYVFPIIKEIEKLNKKTSKIYIPSGHPADLTLKWLAEQRKLKPELHHYIATGEDINGSIKNLCKEIKEKNWYSFNLLALADAHIVGLKNTDWKTDFIYAGFDSCITESARGVYNFTPIRKQDKVVGYSFHNEITNDYPYEEFEKNNQIQNLLKFVGKDAFSVVASEKETQKFLNQTQTIRNSKPYNEKLYRIDQIFSKEEIKNKKINLLGKFVDSSLSVFYDKNADDRIIFKKYDCEGSGRPSVFTMWGACFSMFNAIANDISLEENYFEKINEFTFSMKCIEMSKKNNNFEKWEERLLKAADLEKAFMPKALEPHRVTVYEELANFYYDNKEYKKAADCLNRALYILANQLDNGLVKMSFAEIKKGYDIYKSSFENSMDYNRAKKEYLDAPFWAKFFLTNPTLPNNYNQYKKYEKYRENYEYFNKRFIDFYRKLGRICAEMGEDFPSQICKKAAYDLSQASTRGDEIIKRRQNGIIYIGDLYETK